MYSDLKFSSSRELDMFRGSRKIRSTDLVRTLAVCESHTKLVGPASFCLGPTNSVRGACMGSIRTGIFTQKCGGLIMFQHYFFFLWLELSTSSKLADPNHYPSSFALSFFLKVRAEKIIQGGRESVCFGETKSFVA